MPFKVEERFEVAAPLERVWKYMIDPARVVVCIPGAELLESREDQSFLGAVKVKVGPITSAYKGVIKFTEIDEQNHRVSLVGDGREAGGGGSAKVTMSSQLTALAAGGTEVIVNAEVDLIGKIVQFGRGMIEEVSRQLFRQFSACVKQHLEVEETPPPSPGPAVEAPPGQEPPAQKVEEVKPVSAGQLAFKALVAVLSRFVRRLFGKTKD
jgi:carbon monoxide dehydrogenase subunit G